MDAQFGLSRNQYLPHGRVQLYLDDNLETPSYATGLDYGKHVWHFVCCSGFLITILLYRKCGMFRWIEWEYVFVAAGFEAVWARVTLRFV